MKNEELMAMLQTALQMEEKGYGFYEEAAKNASSEEVKKLFSKLRDEEIVHAERIKKIFAQIQSQGTWSEDVSSFMKPDKALDRIFKELKKGGKVEKTASELQAIDVASGLEEKSIAFYEEHLRKAESALEKRFLEAMVSEERSHFQALRTMKLFLEDPSAFYEELEKSHVDGG